MYADKLRPITEHLEEIRRRVIHVLLAFGALMTVFLFLPSFNNSVAAWIIKYMRDRFLDKGITLVFLSPMEPFFAAMKVSFFLSCVIVSPYVFHQLFAFLAPALTEKQRKFALWFRAGSFFFFILGCVFSWFVLIPITFKIFLDYGASMSAVPHLTVYAFCNFVIIMLVVFGLPFELPMVMGILAAMNIVNADTFRKHRRIVYVIITVFAGIVTPDPTPVSMTILTLALWVLYEVGILFCRLLGKPAIPLPVNEMRQIGSGS